MNCRYCNQEVTTPIKTLSYWNQHPFICHVECKVSGERQEAIDCQTIDADCNDCKYFQRGEVVKRWLSAMINKKAGVLLVNMGIIKGHCLKFDRPTEAYPHASTGWDCFEHRRP